jgi:type I restriction enzyme S subunit
MSNELGELPEGWEQAALEDVCVPIAQVNPGKTPAWKFKYVDISSIDNRQGEIVTTKEYSGEDAPSRARKPIKTGDVLFSTVRPYLRNIASVPPELDGQMASTGFCVLRAGSHVDSRYLFRYVLRDEFVQQVTAAQRGISYPAVTDRDVYSLLITFPALPEQRRIVSKIERLFEQSRTAREALDGVPALLKRFRQSMLAAAFRGELTERAPSDEPASVLLERIRTERRRKWEEDLQAKGKDPKKAKYVEPEPPDTSDLPALPGGWVWTTLGSTFEVYTGGTPARKRPDYWNGEVPWVSSGEVAFCRIKDTHERITQQGLDNSNAKLHLPGTVLLAMIGEGRTRGQSAILDIAASNNQNVAAILCSLTSVPPEYVFYWLMARYDETRGGGQGGAQPALNGARVKQVPLPLAPLAEQRRIVARVEALFAQADAVERAVESARRRAEKVDQAILARAFRGEL